MKTAISLPDDLFEIAERLAAQRGISRSALYATALRAYIEAHAPDDLRERIDAFCIRVDTSLPEDLSGAARAALKSSDW
jgi:metal-responsive CopG/Arc/MetJ family transcriptional regulator